MKTLIVTGGAGFIGSNFIHHLFSKQSFSGKVINLDKLTYAGNLNNLTAIENQFGGNRYFFEHADICDNSRVSEIFNKYKPDIIVNFAAESHVDRSIDSPMDFINTNITGTAILLQNALHHYRSLDKDSKNQFRFLHVSTDEVYGSLGDEGLFEETTSYDPNSPYSASKASSDHLVRAWYRTFGLPVLITNCSNNYGPYQFPEKLIPLMITKCLNHRPLPVYGNGLNVRDWLHVDDHCEAIVLVITKGKVGETYNIGGRNEIRNIDLVNKICRITDTLKPSDRVESYTELITFVQDRPCNDSRYAIDSTKIELELGWKPAVHFEDGLHKTIEWYALYSGRLS